MTCLGKRAGHIALEDYLHVVNIARVHGEEQLAILGIEAEQELGDERVPAAVPDVVHPVLLCLRPKTPLAVLWRGQLHRCRGEGAMSYEYTPPTLL